MGNHPQSLTALTLERYQQADKKRLRPYDKDIFAAKRQKRNKEKANAQKQEFGSPIPRPSLRLPNTCFSRRPTFD